MQTNAAYAQVDMDDWKTGADGADRKYRPTNILDALKNILPYVNSVSRNIYKMTSDEIKKYKIKQLPTNLMEALEEFENDDVLINGIGRDAADLFIEKKRNEWNRYMGEITELDYEFYFNC